MLLDGVENNFTDSLYLGTYVHCRRRNSLTLNAIFMLSISNATGCRVRVVLAHWVGAH
jgi:hypothetical protein